MLRSSPLGPANKNKVSHGNALVDPGKPRPVAVVPTSAGKRRDQPTILLIPGCTDKTCVLAAACDVSAAITTVLLSKALTLETVPSFASVTFSPNSLAA